MRRAVSGAAVGEWAHHSRVWCRASALRDGPLSASNAFGERALTRRAPRATVAQANVVRSFGWIVRACTCPPVCLPVCLCDWSFVRSFVLPCACVCGVPL